MSDPAAEMKQEFALPKTSSLEDIEVAINNTEDVGFELDSLTHGTAEEGELREFTYLLFTARQENLPGRVVLHTVTANLTDEALGAMVRELNQRGESTISFADVWINGVLTPVLAMRENGVAAAAASPTAVETILRGDGSFPFVARVDGNDLTVENVHCTFFGGDDDDQDNGETASGIRTKGNPTLRGCALPMDNAGSRKTDGSPIPRLPYRTTMVRVKNRANGRTVVVPLIDLGPSKFAPSHAAIDLTKQAFLDLGAALSTGNILVDYRIIGGASAIPRTPSSGSLRERPVPAQPARRVNGHGSSNEVSKPAVISTFLSPNRSSRDGAAINMIVLHCTEGSLQSAINEFMNPGGRHVSAHYVIDRNGRIYQMVPDSERANHCKGANEHSIGIEHVGLETQPLAADQEKASAALLRWLMAQYKIPPTRIFGHDFAPGYNGGGTSCPDRLFGHGHSQQVVTNWVMQKVVA